MIDWIIAKRIATFVAGTGEARPPEVDLAALATEAESRVVAYTGLRPARPLPPPEGITRQEWVGTNIDSMRLLLDPVLQRANDNLGPLKPAIEIGMGIILSTEVGVVVGYLAQRVLGQYELVLLDEAVEDRPPRLLFVLPNLGQAVQAFGAEEKEFMTWVALHEVTHAVQFAGVPWLHSYVAGLVRELLNTAELRIESGSDRKFKLPTGDDNVWDQKKKFDPATGTIVPGDVQTVDQSIQPGDGGLGEFLEVSGFKSSKSGLETFYGTASYLLNPGAVKFLFDDLSKRYATRTGGYTRLVHAGWRKGDGADVAVLELVDNEVLQRLAAKRAKKVEARRKATEEAKAKEQTPPTQGEGGDKK